MLEIEKRARTVCYVIPVMWSNKNKKVRRHDGEDAQMHRSNNDQYKS